MKVSFQGVESRRSEWEEWRKDKYGSSEVGAILGLDPYCSPLDLWAYRTGKRQFELNDAMMFGQFVEAALQKMWAWKNPEFKLENCEDTYEHEQYPWATASPDSWIDPLKEVIEETTGTVLEGRGILECKHTAIRGGDWGDGAPDYHIAQVNWQLGICGLQYGYIGALLGGVANDFRSLPLLFDPELFELLLEKVKEFRSFVESDTPPPPDRGSDSKLLDEIISRNERSVTITDQIDQVLEDYDSSLALRKDAEKLVKAYKEQETHALAILKSHMGDASRAVLPDGRAITLKQIQNKGYTVEPFQYWTCKIK